MTQAAERFTVVVSDAGQYSIWRSDRPLPEGWSRTDVSGGKDDCLQHIARVWTDIRPRRTGGAR